MTSRVSERTRLENLVTRLSTGHPFFIGYNAKDCEMIRLRLRDFDVESARLVDDLIKQKKIENKKDGEKDVR